MKKIAIIIDSLTGGGAEKVMLNLAESFIAQGHIVSIFALKKHVAYSLPEGLSIVFPFQDYKKPIRGWFNRKTLVKYLKHAVIEQEKTHAFDLFLVNLYESYRLAQACDFKNCHYVIHNDFNSELAREIKMGPIKYVYMRRILKGLTGKHLVAVSKGLAQALERTSLFTPKSVKQIYNPVDVSQIQDLANAPKPKEMPSRYILHVGRAAKAKRHDVLFQAMKHVDGDIPLVCLSASTKKLQKLGRKFQIDAQLVLPGFATNPYVWMKHASALVIASDYEGFPLVLLEALACGTQVISTDCDYGPREVLTGALSTNLVAKDNPLALASKINDILASNPTSDLPPIFAQLHQDKIAGAYLDLLPN
ncbi:glycosyltransferase [Agaribacter flavus]|uniref:Glycosyltransferase n=1 Tax=Agaribacter flavus TaxID=1902781 RepID=A0ABV7FXT1_9ALTE